MRTVSISRSSCALHWRSISIEAVASSPVGRCGSVRKRIVAGAPPDQDRRYSVPSAIGRSAGQSSVESPSCQLSWRVCPAPATVKVPAAPASCRHKATWFGGDTQTLALLATSTCQMLGGRSGPLSIPRTAPIRARRPLTVPVVAASCAGALDAEAAVKLPGPRSSRVPRPSSRVSWSLAWRTIRALSGSLLPSGKLLADGPTERTTRMSAMAVPVPSRSRGRMIARNARLFRSKGKATSRTGFSKTIHEILEGRILAGRRDFVQLGERRNVPAVEAQPEVGQPLAHRRIHMRERLPDLDRRGASAEHDAAERPEQVAAAALLGF